MPKIWFFKILENCWGKQDSRCQDPPKREICSWFYFGGICIFLAQILAQILISATKNDGSANRRETSTVFGNITGLGTKVESRHAKAVKNWRHPIGGSQWDWRDRELIQKLPISPEVHTENLNFKKEGNKILDRKLLEGIAKCSTVLQGKEEKSVVRKFSKRWAFIITLGFQLRSFKE